MRSTDERIVELNRGTVSGAQADLISASPSAAVSGVGASLCLIVLFSYKMPELMGQAAAGGFDYIGTAASVFYQGSTLSYMLIGLLSFVLGSAVTILCHLLHAKTAENQENDDDRADR